MVKITNITNGVSIIHDFLESDEQIIQKLENEITWNNFTINNKQIQRTGCFQGQVEEKYSPWLRCPSIEHQKIYPFSDTVFQIKKQIQKITGYDTNIAKIQKYKDGTEGINSHSDKIIDLCQKTPIFIYRVGENRKCVLSAKNSIEHRDDDLIFEVPHNSLLIIDYEANLKFKHGILKDETEKPSYSIVFRKSITFLHSSGYVFGQNTPFKTIRDVENFNKENQIQKYFSKERQKSVIIECYNQENNNHDININLYKEVMDNCIYPY